MNYPEEAPKLPKFPFIAGDLVLIATAVLIALRSTTPLGPGALLAITICVVFGAALLVIPFLANYARRQDAELTERQHQIAALARTTAESAEQLGIATAGLHGIAESSKQNLDIIGKLPARLQERIDSLTQQLAGSAIASQASIKEELAQLDAAAERINRTLAGLGAAAKTKSDALAALEQDLAAALARATTQIDAFVATAITNAVRAEPLAMPPEKPAAVTAPVPDPAEPKPKAASKSKVKTPPLAQTHASPDAHPTNGVPADHIIPSEPAPVTEPAPMPAVIEPEPVAPAKAALPPSAAEPEPASENALPAPVAESFPPSEPDAAEVPVDEPPAPKSPRVRKNKSTDDDGFDLGLISDAQESPESAVTSDGFTRLVATAYIGIGNRLFIRGEGPGLSWEKGVPLQFVSIGKWRWETPDATAPISAKLYKNDQVECLGLGTLTLEPGRQHEVNAGF